LVHRRFKASGSRQLHVADFICVPMDAGKAAYTAFVTGAFAGLIPGWKCSLDMKPAFAGTAICQAAAYGARRGRPFTGKAVHHSDIGASTRAFISPGP
jgi:putative transposase